MFVSSTLQCIVFHNKVSILFSDHQLISIGKKLPLISSYSTIHPPLFDNNEQLDNSVCYSSRLVYHMQKKLHFYWHWLTLCVRHIERKRLQTITFIFFRSNVLYLLNRNTDCGDFYSTYDKKQCTTYTWSSLKITLSWRLPPVDIHQRDIRA